MARLVYLMLCEQVARFMASQWLGLWLVMWVDLWLVAWQDLALDLWLYV